MPKKSKRIKKPRQYKQKSTKKKDKKSKSIYQNVNVHVQSGGGGGGSAMPTPSFGNAIPMQFANTAGENTKFQQLIDIVKNFNKPVNEPNRFDFVDLNNRPLRENPRPEPMLIDPVPSQPAEQPNMVPVLFNQPINNNISLQDMVKQNVYALDENIPTVINKTTGLPMLKTKNRNNFNAPIVNNNSLTDNVIEQLVKKAQDEEYEQQREDPVISYDEIFENTEMVEGKNPIARPQENNKVEYKIMPDEEHPYADKEIEELANKQYEEYLASGGQPLVLGISPGTTTNPNYKKHTSRNKKDVKVQPDVINEEEIQYLAENNMLPQLKNKTNTTTTPNNKKKTSKYVKKEDRKHHDAIKYSTINVTDKERFDKFVDERFHKKFGSLNEKEEDQLYMMMQLKSGWL